MEPEHLRLVRHEHREELRRAGSPRRRAARAVTGRGRVALVEDEVDRRRARAQPLRQQMRPAAPATGCPPSRIFRFARTSRCASVGSGTRKARAISGVVRARRAALSVSATCELGGERRVAAGEDQLEPLVGDRRSPRPPGRMGPAPRAVRGAPSCARASARAGCGRSRGCARSRRSTPPGFAGAPSRGHRSRARRERILHRVLGEIEVAEDAGEDGDAAGPLVPVGAVDRVYAPSSAVASTTGRISTVTEAGGAGSAARPARSPRRAYSTSIR